MDPWVGKERKEKGEREKRKAESEVILGSTLDPI